MVMDRELVALRQAERERERGRAVADYAARRAVYEEVVAAGMAAAKQAFSSLEPQELEAYVRHIGAHACFGAPMIAVQWVVPKGVTANFLDDHRAWAIASREESGPRVYVPAVQSALTASVALHELGHHREPDGFNSRRIRQELAAERFRLAHALVWDDECHAHLEHNLTGALKDGDTSDAAAVVDVEALLQESARVRRPTAALRTRFEAFEVQRPGPHGPRLCEHVGCESRAAHLDQWAVFCASCYTERVIARTRRKQIVARIAAGIG